MGYYSRISGSIFFDPPLNESEISDMSEMPEFNHYNYFGFLIVKHRESIGGGVLHHRSSNEIIYTSDDDLTAYTTRDQLEWFVKQLPGRIFTGEFRITGEESLDISRWFVDNETGAVIEWKPKVVWPDGKEE